jgi:leucyl aminopeptidase (aminopeptidase T)
VSDLERLAAISPRRLAANARHEVRFTSQRGGDLTLRLERHPALERHRNTR